MYDPGVKSVISQVDKVILVSVVSVHGTIMLMSFTGVKGDQSSL